MYRYKDSEWSGVSIGFYRRHSLSYRLSINQHLSAQLYNPFKQSSTKHIHIYKHTHTHISQAKSKSSVLLECSRLEEFVGNAPAARDILTRAEQELRSEWKICLELVLLQVQPVLIVVGAVTIVLLK
jgi:hypothetical protein